MGVSFGLSRRDVATRSVRFQHAVTGVHEAGHAVLMEALGYQVTSVEIWRDGTSHPGVTRCAKEPPPDPAVLTALAGRVAERHWAGLLNRGGVTDGPVPQFVEVATSSADDAIVYDALPHSRFASRLDAERVTKSLVKRHWNAIVERGQSIAAQCSCTPDDEPEPVAAPPSQQPQPVAQQQFSGGTTVSSVDEIRGAMSAANDRATQVMGALQQALLDVEEIQQTLHTAADSSSHSSAQEAIGSFAKAQEAISDLQGLVNAGRDAAEQYSAAL